MFDFLKKKRTTSKRFSRAYDAASTARRMFGWKAAGGDANSTLLGGLTTIRNRARDQARNNPWCSSALDSLVANVTDPGIKPISRSEDERFRTEIRQLWDLWGEDADAAGVLSFDLLVGLSFRSMCESGEVFLRLRPRRMEDGLAVPLQVQVIESDHCPLDHTTRAPNGNKIIAGIEFDKLGRRVAYWMYPEHPGQYATISESYNELKRVDASEIIHVYDPARPGQVRGAPKMAAILTRLKDLDEYESAELTKKKISSLFVGSIHSPAPDADLLDEEEGMDEQPNVNWARLEPGTIMSLEPGEELSFNDPPAADSTYEPHVKMNLRAIAAGGFGVTYEQMTGDLTGVNFSSIRAGLNEFQRRARRLQRLLIHQLCRPVWMAFLDSAVISGAIAAPGPVSQMRIWGRVEWRAPGWRYVNPQQEITANKEKIKAGLASRAGIAAEEGYDINEIDAQIAEDHARAQKLGLKYDTDPIGQQPSGFGGGASQTDPNADASADPVADVNPTAPNRSSRSKTRAKGRTHELIAGKIEEIAAEQNEALEAALDDVLGGVDASN